MSIYKTIAFFFLLVPSLVHSQEIEAELKWSATSEAAGGNSFIYFTKIAGVDTSGDVCVCGQKSIANGVDFGMYAIRYDSSGMQKWQNVYQTLVLDRIFDCELDGEGNLIMGGVSSFFQGPKMAVVKYSAEGNEEWVFSYGEFEVINSHMRDLFIDAEGNVFILGTKEVIDDGSYMILIKLNPDGEMVWMNTFQESGTHGRYGGRLLDDRIVVLGLKSADGGKYLIHQIGLDGETLGTSEIDKEDEIFRYFTIDHEGNIYLGDEAREYKVTKVSLEGDTLWHYVKPVIDPPTPTGVFARLIGLKADNIGNFYAVGPYYENDTGFGILTTKLDENGNVVWSDRFSHESIETGDVPSDVFISEEFVFVLGGTYQNTSTGDDYLILIYSVEGENLLNLEYDYNGNEIDRASSITVNGDNIYITGVTEGVFSADSTIILTQRYCIDGLTSAVSQQKLVEGVEVYPNPFSDQINIDQENSDIEFRHFGLYDVSGSKVYSGAISDGQSQISPPASLPVGVYLLRLEAENGSEMVKLILKVE